MDKQFIFTSSEESADKMTNQGFILVQKDDNGWTFLNQSHLNFEGIENIIFTNRLNF